MRKAMPLSPARKHIFFSVIRATGNVSAAIRGAGISRKKAYALRRDDAEFRAIWEDAVEEALDDFEQEMRRRAIEGTERPVFFGGRQCGSIKTYSDRLGMFLLKGRRPEVFGGARGRLKPDGKEPALPLSPRERLLAKLKAMQG